MGLAWIRLDTQLPSNPKILKLVAMKKREAICVYVLGLAHCGAHGTDGMILDVALPTLFCTRSDAAALVSVGLWHKDKVGYLVNDWEDYQQLSAKTAEVRASKSVGGRKGACRRFHPEGCECWRDPPPDD